MFLETPGDLSTNMRWTGMMPPSASVLEGTAKFSMQLIGRESKVNQSTLRQAAQHHTHPTAAAALIFA